MPSVLGGISGYAKDFAERMGVEVAYLQGVYEKDQETTKAMQEEIARANNKSKKDQEMMAAMQEQIAKSEEAFRDLVSKLSKVEREKSDLATKLEDAHKELREVRGINVNLEGEVKGKVEELARVNKDKNDLTKDLAKSRDENDSLEEVKRRLEQKVEVVSIAYAQKASINGVTEELNANVKGLENALVEAKTDLKENDAFCDEQSKEIDKAVEMALNGPPEAINDARDALARVGSKTEEKQSTRKAKKRARSHLNRLEGGKRAREEAEELNVPDAENSNLLNDNDVDGVNGGDVVTLN